ncbi:SWPV1-280 [Shearwaterpox virus]|uniref:SWPV1-280 n=1 Tax=Shearwaterpox virus TaxID=1974596 RepID=A0A1V0S8E7_CNPV|nr:SWPV1-280 [Shearwaterpox virus]
MWTLYRVICMESMEDVVDIIRIHGYEEGFYQSTFRIPYIPLHQAVDCRSIKIVEHMLCNNYNVNVEDSNGVTPLHIICSLPNVKEISKFIEHEPFYNNIILLTYKELIKNNTYDARQRIELVKLFLKKDIKDLDFNDIRTKSIENEISIAKKLISYGACINHSDINGNTPLHIAVKNKNFNLIKLLLENGAVPNISNKDKITPLHISVNNNNIDILKILIEYCVTKNITLERSLIYNSIHQRNTDSIKLLVDNGMDINAVDEDYDFTPLHYAACYVADISVVKYLIKVGADVNKKSGLFQTTPLFGALRNKNMTELLIDNGADINYMDCCGNTPLMTLYNKYKDVKADVARIIITEIASQESLGNISKNVGLQKNIEFVNSSTFLKSVKNECNNELNKMKQTILNGYSMYSLTIGNNKQHLYKVINAISISESYVINNFPLYGRYINNLIKKAITRSNKILKCYDMLNVILKDVKTNDIYCWQYLPNEIKLEIINKLSDDDVTILYDNIK